VNLPTYSRAKTPDHVADRRSVYLPLLRSPPDGPLEILNVFDFPHPSEITGQRPERTVATQALFLMNAPFVEEQARPTPERRWPSRHATSPCDLATSRQWTG